MRSTIRWISVLLAAAWVAPGAAHAQPVEEPWFFAGDLGVTGALNSPPSDQFSAGGESSFAVYRSLLPELALGGQLRIGILGEGQVVLQDPVNRGQLDWEMLSANLRVRPLASVMGDTDRRATGLYIDAAAGLSLLDGDATPAFAAAVGWNFGIGPVAIGPKIRFSHFVETSGRFADNDVFMLTGAIEVAFLDSVQPVVGAAGMQPTATLDREWETQIGEDPDVIGREDDRIAAELDREAELEEFVNDALIVDERVFFDFDRAELREAGIAELDAIVDHYRQHGDRYDVLIVSGHADARGTVEYNEDLSRRRAEAVVDYLTEQGVPREVLDVRAYGELRPEYVEAQSSLEHQVNRRVDFDVRWAEGRRPLGIAPEPNPTMPDRIDDAPPAVLAREELPAVREREAQERQLAMAELRRAEEEREAARIADARMAEAQLREAQAFGPEARIEAAD